MLRMWKRRFACRGAGCVPGRSPVGVAGPDAVPENAAAAHIHQYPSAVTGRGHAARFIHKRGKAMEYRPLRLRRNRSDLKHFPVIDGSVQFHSCFYHQKGRIGSVIDCIIQPHGIAVVNGNLLGFPQQGRRHHLIAKITIRLFDSHRLCKGLHRFHSPLPFPPRIKLQFLLFSEKHTTSSIIQKQSVQSIIISVASLLDCFIQNKVIPLPPLAFCHHLL